MILLNRLQKKEEDDEDDIVKPMTKTKETIDTRLAKKI